jgi:large subunit ribosomal protein L18
MRDEAKLKREKRQRRHSRVRKRVVGTPERPRLAVFRSNRHISAQIIDDVHGKTLCSMTTACKTVQEATADLTGKGKIEKSRQLGEMLAQKAKEVGISRVVFDRGGYRYHGRVKALAEGARKDGVLDF